MPFNRTRYILFWVIDYLKGRKIKLHMDDISSILKNPNSPQSLKKRQQHLDNLLEHASNTTEFYKKYKTKKIAEFPIIKKNIIQQNFEDFKSIPYKNKSNYKVSTSGSTGIPFFLYQDASKRYRNTADVLYFSKEANYTIGNCLYELEVWRNHNKKGKLKSWVQNVKQFDISKLTDSRILSFLNKLKKDKQKKTLLGFASAYESICQYIDRENIVLSDLNIASIIANSEYLNAYTKTAMKKHFNAPVLSRYSSEEVGIIAHQTIKSQEHFTINHASYYVEILNLEKDIPAKPGEFGRIVVTDLFNYCMPIIRYDTGDISKIIVLENNQTKFEQIEGRRMDQIYDSKGNMVSSFVVYTNFYKYYHLLKQYQFIQEGEKEYVIKLNILDTFPFEKELIESIKNTFGNDIDVKIIFEDEIPLLDSGKRKKVVNNYHKM